MVRSLPGVVTRCLVGGLWLRMILPSGLWTWLVPSGWTVNRSAELVQQHVVVPPAIIFEVGEAGGAAVGPVGHVVGFASGGGWS